MTGAALRCRVCERTHPLAPVSTCAACQGPLDVDYDVETTDGRAGDFLPRVDGRIEAPGLTPLVRAPRLADALGIDLLLKLEDANPTHSFKDRIAAAAVAAARAFELGTVCCASTGNLGEAVAARCAALGLDAVVLSPATAAPLAPLTAFGARVFAVDGTFDDCRRLERELEELLPWGFANGNLHAIGAEGAKSVAYEIAEQLDGTLPDAVVAPVASGTLLAKLAQGFNELVGHDPFIGRAPRIYGAQAGGCPPLAAAWADDRPPSRVRTATEVRSLAVGDPSYGDLAVGAARMSGGAILAVPEQDIARRTAVLAQTTGVFADSAGGVALGALLELVRTGAIAEGERVVLVVTGSGLKPYGYEIEPVVEHVEPNVRALIDAIGAG